MNVEVAGREEKFFIEWEGVFLLLLSVLLIIIHFMECVFYKIYVICFAVTCVQLSCMPEICFSGFNLCVQLIVCSFLV